MRNRSLWFGVLLTITLAVCMSWAALQAEEPPLADTPAADTAAAEVVFDLQEKSVFEDRPGSRSYELTRGARATCEEQPYAEVKAYPPLHSKKPIYGLLRLAPEVSKQDSGMPLHFVVDESGETPDAATPKQGTQEEQPSLLDKLRNALSGSNDEQSAPELAPLNNTYDRLYIDLNGDLDLTNDPVVVPMKRPPEGAVHRYSSMRQLVVFDEISVPLDFGPELGSRPVRLVPRLEIQEYEGKEYPGIGFISAVVREGDIKIGNRSHHAIVAQSYFITGRFDHPYTRLFLTSSDNPDRDEYWWGGDQLRAMRVADGQYYTTTMTPLGDKMIVTRYQGDFGLLKIGPGDRKLDKLSIQGSLETRSTALAVGAPSDEPSGGLTPVSECRLPVGDYMPDYVTIQYGHLQLSISQNYHSDGKPQDIDRNAWSYGIKIRKDETFVWDFSTAPEVMFASPAKEQTFKRGDEINVKAVLIDPQLTIMIRGLVDTARKEKKTVDYGNGETSSYETAVSLDPTVTITNAAGTPVAEGKLPFG